MHRINQYHKLLLIPLFFFGLTPSYASSSTKEMVLANGLKVIVRQDSRAPVVTSQIWYRVGSFDETRGMTGLSHALEHMMFKGTTLYPGNRLTKLISELGGYNNAFTSYDYTGYYEELPAKDLETSFALESDRMLNLILPESEFIKEIEVVKEERRLRTEDNPISATLELFNATAFMNGPYHHSVIGWMEDLNQMTIDDLKGWYQRWYKPSNATIVVVGDVEHSTVFELAKKYFSSLPDSKVDRGKSITELTQKGERRIENHIRASIPYLMIGYHVPSKIMDESKSESYALELLTAVLSSGNSARLDKEMIRKDRIAAYAGADYDLLKRGLSLFTFMGTPAEGKTLQDLEQAFDLQIAKLQTELISKEDLERAKNKIQAQEVFKKDSMTEQANLIGIFEMTGSSWKDEEEYFKEIQKVTPAQIQAVAKKYFQVNKRTVAKLIPVAPESKNEG